MVLVLTGNNYQQAQKNQRTKQIGEITRVGSMTSVLDLLF
jgi:hypothetical protein